MSSTRLPGRTLHHKSTGTHHRWHMRPVPRPLWSTSRSSLQRGNIDWTTDARDAHSQPRRRPHDDCMFEDLFFRLLQEHLLRRAHLHQTHMTCHRKCRTQQGPTDGKPVYLSNIAKPKANPVNISASSRRVPQACLEFLKERCFLQFSSLAHSFRYR